MHKTNHSKHSPIRLEEESIETLVPFSFEQALARGIIVEVSDWADADIGFGRRFYRTRIALTARVWDTLLQSCVRNKNAERERDYQARSKDILWLAAQALKESGRDAVSFSISLPMGNGIEDCRTVRVECREREEHRYSQVLIGYPEDFLRLG